MIEFDSLNPYQNMEVLIAEDPMSLLALIKAQRTPIKIVAIVPYGTRQAAYILGDIRFTNKQTTKKPKGV
jgi:hypothetical protein